MTAVYQAYMRIMRTTKTQKLKIASSPGIVEWTEIELRNSSEKKLQQLKLNYPITNIRLLMKEYPEEIDELKTADVDKEPEILEIRQKFK